ncbi:MAG: phosphotransferase [Deltaproteobacteria bacterium]|nr:phosphotransferase [Deltaproteobacteria bacterium]MBI3293771.1 phosphotransferase [Deltaproteobacteria bacterium]
MIISSLRLSQAQQAWVTNQLKGALGDSPTGYQLLAGDGSSRSFYRVTTNGRPAILVVDPEWVQTRDYTAHNNFLRKHRIPTPTFYGENPALGLLLMEDLGDTLLQTPVRETAEKISLLKRSVGILAELHGKTFPVPNALPVATRSFNQAKLMEEFRFTETHLIEKFLGLPPLSSTAISTLEKFSQRIAELTPRVFTHRDYHTRNILFAQQELFLIDFQDARMGPPHYDLASILYDPYVLLSDADRSILRKEYEKHLQPFAVAKLIDWPRFDQDLETVAFQRLIKAAGSFASFFTRFGKRTHLQYLVPALQTAQSLTVAPSLDSAVPLKSWLERIEKAKLIE